MAKTLRVRTADGWATKDSYLLAEEVDDNFLELENHFSWKNVTSDYTVSKNEKLLCNTNNGSFTIFCKEFPKVGQQFQLSDPTNNWSNNPITLDGNGYTIDGENSVTFKTPGSHIIAIFNSNNEWTIKSSNDQSSSSYIKMLPWHFNVDNQNDGVVRGDSFGMFESLNFSSNSIGSIWGSLDLSQFHSEVNVNISLIYNLNGSDADQNYVINTDFWYLNDGDTPSESTPSESYSDTISTTSTQGVLRRTELTNTIIPSSNIDQNIIAFAFKMTRNVDDSNDTYSGTVELIGIEFYQDV